jgi:hypothetical protein
LENEMSRVHKEHMPFALLGFFKAWLEFVFQKGLLLLRVCLGRNLTHLEPLHPQLLGQELIHLGWRATNPGEPLDTLDSLVDGGRRTGLELYLQCFNVLLQHAEWFVKVQFLQPLQTAGPVHLQICPNRWLADPCNTANLLVRIAERLQVNHLTTLAHARVWVVKMFVMQPFNLFRSELNLNHLSLLRSGCCGQVLIMLTEAKSASPSPRAQSNERLRPLKV